MVVVGRRRQRYLIFLICAGACLSACDKQISDFIGNNRLKIDEVHSVTPNTPTTPIASPSPSPTPPPSGLSYNSNSLKAFQGESISNLTPVVTGSVSNYSISPALPTGLIFNTTTGVISGTPNSIQAKTVHTITASNSGGDTSTTIAISAGSLYSITTTANASDSNTADGVCNDGSANCTLRAAIEQANADSAPAKIVLPAGTYTLGGSEISITSDVTLVGASRATTIISGSTSTRIFNMSSTSKDVSISKMTLSGGKGGSTANSAGGAIKAALTNGTLKIDDMLFTNNTTASTNGGGGAVYFAGGDIQISNSSFTSNTDTAGAGSNIGGGAVHISTCQIDSVIRNTTFSSNTTSMHGGALYFHTCTSAKVIDSTFLSNTSSRSGGGAIFIYGGMDHTIIENSMFKNNTAVGAFGSGGALYLADPVWTEIKNSTFSGNTSVTTGGAIYVESDSVFDTPTFSNLTFSGNSATTSGSAFYCDQCSQNGINFINTIFGVNTGSNCGKAMAKGVFSLGYNIDNSNTCGLNATGDIINTNPLLSAAGPASNGGPTETIALQSSSPARDAGSPSTCLATDQRGTVRPNGGACDIGAYEY